MASAAMTGSHPVSVSTFGHAEDGVYNNRFCAPSGIPGLVLAPLFLSAFVPTQVVSGAAGGLRHIPNAAQYQHGGFECVSATHRSPFTLLTFDVADTIGEQIR